MDHLDHLSRILEPLKPTALTKEAEKPIPSRTTIHSCISEIKDTIFDLKSTVSLLEDQLLTLNKIYER